MCDCVKDREDHCSACFAKINEYLGCLLKVAAATSRSLQVAKGFCDECTKGHMDQVWLQMLREYWKDATLTKDEKILVLEAIRGAISPNIPVPQCDEFLKEIRGY